MSFFKALHVVKAYGERRALDDVSIVVPGGSIYGLLGPNGAGKTSLIRVINQITAPDEGELLFHGRPLRREDVNRIGYLPEERGLYRKMRVGEQVVYLARLKGLSRQDAVERARMWFEKFGIGGWWNRRVEELSKGMAQKVQFITTVLHEPELLIFDEPFSGFDPINVELLKREIWELQRKGTTIIFSTHNMGSVEEICSHIALLSGGKKVVEGPIHQVREKYAGNTYRLGCRYNATFRAEEAVGEEFRVLSRRVTGDREDIVLQQEGACPANTLLERLLGSVEVLSFEKVIPSMNDIFIRLAGNGPGNQGKGKDDE